MLSYNYCHVAGNLIADPESKNVGDSTVCKINIAVNRKYNSGGQVMEEVVYVEVTIWGRQAEFVQTHMRKGINVMVTGSLKYDKWERDGKPMSRVSILAQRIDFVENKRTNEGAR